MKNIPIIFIGILAVIGCARVSVVAPKEAIKLDVSMRLDVYQHVAKDADNIEDAVSGSPSPKTATPAAPKPQPQVHQSFLNILVPMAYAQEDGFGPDVQAAISRRKDRRADLVALEAKGAIGENASGLVEIRSGTAGGDLVQAENSDRMTIYTAVAQKNGTSVSQTQEVYAKKIQERAPSGTPIQTASGWSIKP
jgi:uncharacterized protein YdbL (DUF1318 family)